MKAFFWAAADDGCKFYRMDLPAAALHNCGHRTLASQSLNHARWGDSDVIVGQRVCHGDASMLWQRWAAEGRRLVFDIDDHYFGFDDTNSQAYEFFNQPQIRADLIRNIGLASAVTCATPRLAQIMSEFSDKAIVVPNGLPGALLDWPAREPRDEVTIGWAGSSSTVAETPLIADAVDRVLYHDPGRVDAELHTVGVPLGSVYQHGLAGLRTRVTPWTQGTWAYLRVIDFDIWLAPYRPTPFNAAKVATKALEAAFLGIPIIASDIEPYRAFVQHGKTGFLVKRPEDWVRYIRRLLDNPGMRQRMGLAAREQAAGHTIERIAPQWEQALGGGS